MRENVLEIEVKVLELLSRKSCLADLEVECCRTNLVESNILASLLKCVLEILISLCKLCVLLLELCLLVCEGSVCCCKGSSRSSCSCKSKSTS